MHPCNVNAALSSMTVLVDTREQDTPSARRRMKQIGVPIERVALSFGDYSTKCNVIDLRDQVAIERKMDLDELCACYGRDRSRFTREFERAKESRSKVIHAGGKRRLGKGVQRRLPEPDVVRVFGSQYASMACPLQLPDSFLRLADKREAHS